MKNTHAWLVIIAQLFALSFYAQQEGFGADTLVHTSFGNHSIQELNACTTITGYNSSIQLVTASTKVLVDRYVRITLADGTVCIGCNQKLCTDVDTWSPAQDLHTGDMLLDRAGNHHLILNVKVVHEYATLYALTVEDHVFCIEPYGLFAHNMAAALGASSLSLGAISITNPIITALGATVALSTIANHAWQTWQTQRCTTTTTPPASVTFAERSYYESRRQELEKIRNELTRIKHDLLMIKARCSPNSYTFTHLFLSTAQCAQQHPLHQWLTMSQDKESRLSKAQQNELRLMRQHDLLVHEHEIITLQAALAVHSNELIEQVNRYCADYRTSLDTLNTNFERFQSTSLDRKAVGQLYACLITQDYTLDRITRIVQEACIIGDYYKHLPTLGSCIASSTTLIDKWQQIASCIAQNMSWINREKQLCNNRMTSVERHLAQCGGAVSTLKNKLTKTIKKHIDTHDARDVSAAINKLEIVMQEGKSATQLPVNTDNSDDNKIDEVEDKDLLKCLLEKRTPDGDIDLGKDPKDPRKKWWNRLMEIMDEFFVKDNNKMEHIIRKIKHGFHDLLKERGFDQDVNKIEWGKAESKLAREIQEKYVRQGNFPSQESSSVFKRIIEIDGYKVTIEGVMHRGMPRIGTAYIAAFREIYKHLM